MSSRMDSDFCRQTINSLKERYKFEIITTVFDESGRAADALIGNDIDILLNLTIGDIQKVGDGYYRLNVLEKDKDHTILGYIDFNIAASMLAGGRNVFYVDLVRSLLKGLGKELLYLITCKAAQLGLPLAFKAQPGVIDSFPSGTNKEIIRKHGEKLLAYYNRLGFTRKGEGKYSKAYGFTQNYLTDPTALIGSVASSRAGAAAGAAAAGAGEGPAAVGGKRRRKSMRRKYKSKTLRLTRRNGSF